MRASVRFSLICAATLAATACSEGSWFGGIDKKPLPGERLSVLSQGRGVEADPRLAQLAVQLPPQTENADWPQPGGYAGEFIPHPAVSGFDVAWRTSIGSGNSRDGRVTASPVVADGRLYVMDAGSRLSALEAATGRRIWSFDVEPSKDRSGGGSSGGAAVDGDRVYVATGYAQIIALEAATGKEIWRTTLTAPFRSGPAVGNGRVFAVGSDNQVHAVEAATGKKLWAYSGLTESAGLYGSASPTLAGGILVAALSSGELFALRPENGRVLWSDTLTGLQRTDAVSALASVRGFPVVDRGQVIASSHASRLVDIDLRSGARLWEQNWGSLNTPWVAGDFLFMITNDAQLVCISRRDGRARWVTQLDLYREPDKKIGLITWAGPILAGGRLFMANSEGKALVVSPQNGEQLTRMSLAGSVSVLPIVANKTIYVLTDDGDLIALR